MRERIWAKAFLLCHLRLHVTLTLTEATLGGKTHEPAQRTHFGRGEPKRAIIYLAEILPTDGKGHMRSRFSMELCVPLRVHDNLFGRCEKPHFSEKTWGGGQRVSFHRGIRFGNGQETPNSVYTGISKTRCSFLVFARFLQLCRKPFLCTKEKQIKPSDERESD